MFSTKSVERIGTDAIDWKGQCKESYSFKMQKAAQSAELRRQNY